MKPLVYEVNNNKHTRLLLQLYYTYTDLSSSAEFKQNRQSIRSNHNVLIRQSHHTRLARRQAAFLRLNAKQLVVHHF